MKKLLILIVCFILFPVKAQIVDWDKLESINPDVILLKEKIPTKVLLLGTFHFDYPGLDSHKIAEENKMDILSEERQKELSELLNVIKKFNPTKIYIESRNQAYHDSLYNRYKLGMLTPDRNEIKQIAYRMGKELNHEKLYAVDAKSLLNEINDSSPQEFKELSNKLYSNEYRLMNGKETLYWQNTYTEMYNVFEAIETKLSLLETFLLMSKPHVLKRMHGHYLSSGFNTIDNQGPDKLALWWYSRNLRIYKNILNTEPKAEDRILVLFGNGHMSILNHLFESAPQFEIVSLESLTKQN